MNSHSKVRIISTLFLSATVIAFGSAPASFAASSATPKPKTTAKVATKAPAKVKTANPKVTKLPTTTGTQGDRAGRFANLTTTQRACLVKQGVKLPASQTGTVRPTPNPSQSPGTFRTRGTFNNPKTIAAFKNCGIAIPTGGFGGQFNSVKFQAFQKCMTAAGFTPTGGFGRYDQSDPSTVAALIKCQKSTGFTLPKPGSSN